MRDLARFAGSADLGAILVIALGLLAFWATLFPDLRTAAAPQGIVSLELPWNAKRAWRIVASWEREGKLGAARRSLLLDLPFIALYLVALVAFDTLIARAGLALGLFSDRAEQWVAAILVCAASLAAVLDLLENLGIRLMLGGRYWAARVTSIVSAGKWALLALASIVGLPLALPRVFPRQWATLKPRWSSRDRWVGCVLAIPTLVLGVWFWRQHAIDPLTAPALLLDVPGAHAGADPGGRALRLCRGTTRPVRDHVHRRDPPASRPPGGGLRRPHAAHRRRPGRTVLPAHPRPPDEADEKVQKPGESDTETEGGFPKEGGDSRPSKQDE
ncbi:MAG: hypothetical protein ACXWWO_05440 [Candidatus Limnocylindria bacterium]